MNKKGFTLIELLSTIAIMGLITVMTSINILKIMDNKKALNTNTKNSIIKTAASVYIELDKNSELKTKCLKQGCDISTTTLINEGLLNSEDVDNPQVIHIYQENNEKKCILK